jgi:DNA-binding FrmR family transcriptional regulator
MPTTNTKRKATTRVPKSTSTARTTQTPRSAAAFKAQDYMPGDLFSASSAAPSLSEVEYTQRLEKIQGQIRAVKIVQKNLSLVNELHIAEGIGIQGQISAAKNAVLGEKLNTQTVKLEQARTQTDIERARLQGLQIALDGENRSLPLQQESWDLKLEGLQVDIEHARRMLSEKREMLPQTIEVLN